MITSARVSAENGRDALLKAVRVLTESHSARVAIYTCGAYIFVIGYRSNRLFLVDTHSIGAELGGNGNGLLKVYPANNDTSPLKLCASIWKRLAHSGVNQKAMQSFLIVDDNILR